jgi:lipopolysaccharide/colanic/teichoic acid biosynthesis glycosyltransferase
MATSYSGVYPELALLDREVGTRRAPRPASRRRAHPWVRHHVLGEALFKDALVRERKRADRFDQPFAVLLLDRNGSDPWAGHWVAILRAVAAVRRDIDVVGWLDQGAVVGLLLPETSGADGLAVVHRLRREIAGRVGDDALAALSIRLHGHGDHSGPEGAALPPVDLLVEPLVQQRGHPWRDAAKRGLDILGSLALLVLFAPVFLSIFIAVKWTSPGPALFRQVRVGRRGEPFTMLKFRTMYLNSGHAIHQDYVTWFIKSGGQQPRTGHEVFKLTNDPRITRVGQFLRRTSLDELPQFWNVLAGDMSLVGPRPPLPFEVEQYRSWHRRRVLDAKPGVTGPWQVNGRSRTTFDEMVRLDLNYATTHSLWTDIKILAATPAAMISGKGAC